MRRLSLITIVAVLAGCVGEPGSVSTPATDGARTPQPNFLLIVADDMGYTDIGAFGSEIATPNLDALAAGGVKLTNFHAAPTCAPTRAMLLSGTDNHTAGLGSMFGPAMLDGIAGADGYERYLRERVAALPEILADAGYHTYMAGKWHLGMTEDKWPSARGFERSFSLLPGSDDHFNPLPENFQENGVALDAMPANYYSTRVFTDKLIDYIDANAGDERPFFAYAAYTSPHWPLQAPEDFIDRYKGRYDDGYAALHEQRVERARALGVIADVDALLPDWLGPTWDELTPELRADYARRMELHAAMVANLDFHVGRLIEYLESSGQLDNTVILFFSDNGADSDEMELNPTFNARLRSRGAVNTLETLGKPGSWISFGAGWAQASMGPYRRFKGFTTEGGTRVPAFVTRGAGSGAQGLDGQYLRVTDVAPTLLELAGIDAPDGTFRGREVAAIEGRSFAGVLDGDTTPVYGADDAVGFELHGHRSLQRGQYKLLWEQAPGNTWWGFPIPETWGRWQLFDLSADPGETTDVSGEHPDIAADLAALWESYAEAHGVVREVSVVDFERWRQPRVTE